MRECGFGTGETNRPEIDPVLLGNPVMWRSGRAGQRRKEGPVHKGTEKMVTRLKKTGSKISSIYKGYKTNSCQVKATINFISFR